MSRVARIIPALVAALLLSLVAGCQQQPTGASFGWKPVFGDLANDTSPVIAQVGDIAISQSDLEQFIDEQPERLKGNFAGPEGERMALRTMVEQSLMVLGAVDRKLYNDQKVARALVMQRRLTLDRAMRQFGLLKDAKPTEQQMREYYDKNVGKFQQQGLVRVRHIECLTKADADRAYRRLMATKTNDEWVKVCEEFSVNEKSKKLSGEVGWMNEGTLVPLIEAGAAFSKAVYNLPLGVNAPIQVGDRWHIVDVLNREAARNSSYEEAQDAVRNEMMPSFQDAIIKEYLKTARAKFGVQLKGRFTPGQGMTPQQLFERAMLNTDMQRRIDILTTIADDFPESDRADDALFMAANTALENFADPTFGGRILEDLVARYPQSDLADDAKFMLEHLYDPRFMQPKSMEDLKH
jgi:peptidyl-prolyl cis-trans isomerase C